MKNTTLALATFLLLLGVLVVNNSVKANFVGFDYARCPPPTPVVRVSSPMESQIFNTYGVLNVTLTFTVHVELWISEYGDLKWSSYYEKNHIYTPSYSIRVWLDGKLYAEPEWQTDQPISMFLSSLRDGKHTLEVNATASGEYMKSGVGIVSYVSEGSSGVLRFNIIPLKVTVFSEQDGTFDTNNIQFNITVNRRPQWIGFSLDGKDNTTITSPPYSVSENGDYYNVALTGLAAGEHAIRVYALDAAGNRASSERFPFVVEDQQPQPEQTSSQNPQPSMAPTSPPDQSPTLPSESPHPSNSPSASIAQSPLPTQEEISSKPEETAKQQTTPNTNFTYITVAAAVIIALTLTFVLKKKKRK